MTWEKGLVIVTGTGRAKADKINEWNWIPFDPLIRIRSVLGDDARRALRGKRISQEGGTASCNKARGGGAQISWSLFALHACQQ